MSWVEEQGLDIDPNGYRNLFATTASKPI